MARDKAKRDAFLLKYLSDNNDRIKETRRRYVKKNKDKVNAKQRKYNAKNKEKINERYRKYYDENSEKIKERQRRSKKQSDTLTLSVFAIPTNPHGDTKKCRIKT